MWLEGLETLEYGEHLSRIEQEIRGQGKG